MIAKDKALEAKKSLLLPKFIKSANMELCWQGRIMRAMDLGQEAMAAQDHDKADKIRKAIQQLEMEMDAQRQEADVLAADYAELCQRAGVTPDPLDVEPCTCFYCTRNRQQDNLWLSESRLRRAVFDLTEPDECGKPLPLCYMGENTEEGKKKAWGLFVELCNAQAQYLATCERLNRFPEWGYILRAW